MECMISIDFVALSIKLNSLTSQQKLNAPHQIILAAVRPLDTAFSPNCPAQFQKEKVKLKCNDFAYAIKKNRKKRYLVHVNARPSWSTSSKMLPQ